MSDKTSHLKLLQVIQNFFTKTSQIILQARSLSDPSVSATSPQAQRIKKWFNLNLASSTEDWVRDEMKLWKSFTDVSQIQPMIIETYLDLRQLGPREIVSLEDDTGNSWTVAKGSSKKQEVVVERWLVEFDRSATSSSSPDELPLIYKQALVLIRVLYGYIRLLPAYKLRKVLCQLTLKSLVLKNKFIDGRNPISSKGRVGLSKPIIPHQMLLTESHLTQKSFAPVQTTMGSLRVSVAYRNHFRFTVQDNEEMLSNQFLNSDNDKVAAQLSNMRVSSLSPTTAGPQPAPEAEEAPRDTPEVSTELSGDQAVARHQLGYQLHPDKILPTSSVEEAKRDPKKLVLYASTATSVQRPSIQPFKAGSISNSPPAVSHLPTGSAGSTMERRISITSNRSGSNASLAALLRNPRGSTSSSHTPAVAIAGSQGTTGGVFPRSISSSHGSHLPDDGNENHSSTPRFSSSFGSRQSRRLSNTSVRNSLLNAEVNAPSLLGASVDLGSSGAPASGLYLDDDIGQFVRMIDCKSDHWLGGGQDSKSGTSQTDSNAQWDALNRFQFLKSQHQHLSDSVNASVVSHNNLSGSISGGDGSRSGSSRPSSRKSSHHSHLPSVAPGSLENRMPSITSRLKESGGNLGNASREDDHPTSHALIVRRSSSGQPNREGPSMSPGFFSSSKQGSEGVTGMATSPSIYAGTKHFPKYESVFEDDEDCSGYFSSRRMESESNNSRVHDCYDNDDLLFEMTDTK